jgi:hypothetical protein
MKRTMVFAALLLALTTTGLAQTPVVVGVCPFFDDTGTDAGERSGILLPVMFLDKSKSAAFLPVIVNPGPSLLPADTQWATEVGRMAGTDAVLVGQVRALATKEGNKPTEEKLRGHILLASHAARLVMEATLVEVASGRELGTWQTEELVKGSWLSEAAARFTGVGAAFHGEAFWFADTHFGKAIGRGADQLVADVGSALSQVKPSGAYNIPSVSGAGQSCRVTVRVLYTQKERASKTYLIAVNGKEESMGIDDGILSLEVPSGPILLHITVKDPPYRQLVQTTYYANSMVDCASKQSTLAFEIGSSGEGLIRWR